MLRKVLGVMIEWPVFYHGADKFNAKFIAETYNEKEKDSNLAVKFTLLLISKLLLYIPKDFFI